MKNIGIIIFSIFIVFIHSNVRSQNINVYKHVNINNPVYQKNLSLVKEELDLQINREIEIFALKH